METEQAKTELERRSKIAMAISNPDLPSTITASIRVPNDFSHTPFYCEENVYFLCKKLGMMGVANAEGTDLFVVFISNEKKQIPLWHQKASKRTDGMVLWDYHVICIQRSGEGTNLDQVWDLDSSLPIPVPLTCYTSGAIRPRSPLHPEYRRLFRVVHAPLFLHFFASDRRHMKDAQGNWIAFPPPYESIVAQDGSVNNLDGYISMRKDDMGAKLEHLVEGVFSRKLGVVINETQLEDFFSTLKLIEVK